MTEMEKIEAATIRALSTPAPPPKFPPTPSQEQVDRLAALERELVEQRLSAGALSPMEIKILVLRAEMYG